MYMHILLEKQKKVRKKGKNISNYLRSSKKRITFATK